MANPSFLPGLQAQETVCQNAKYPPRCRKPGAGAAQPSSTCPGTLLDNDARGRSLAVCSPACFAGSQLPILAGPCRHPSLHIVQASQVHSSDSSRHAEPDTGLGVPASPTNGGQPTNEVSLGICRDGKGPPAQLVGRHHSVLKVACTGQLVLAASAGVGADSSDGCIGPGRHSLGMGCLLPCCLLMEAANAGIAEPLDKLCRCARNHHAGLRLGLSQACSW